MQPRAFQLIAIGMIVFGVALQGCATQSAGSLTDAGVSATAPGPGMRTPSDLVFQYRQQAAALREMAKRLEIEAEWYAQHQASEQAKRNHDMAKDLRSAADTAEERAREYRSQLPHGQVY